MTWEVKRVIINIRNNTHYFLYLAVVVCEFFSILYKWMYYRHLFENFGLQLKDFFDCYVNYCSLFNYIMVGNPPEAGPKDLDLPGRLAWDILDFFILQFEVFNIKKGFFEKLSPDDIRQLKEKVEAWDVHSILNVLYSFVHTSKINEQLIANNTHGDVVQAAGAHGMKPTYRTFGYCSLVCLVRVQCSLGDYALALKTAEHLDISSKGLLARIGPCHVSSHYYMGFAYMMSRRYSDAVNTFCHILLYILRMKNTGNKPQLSDDITRKTECIYALLTICVAMTKQRIDESIHNLLREKHGDNIHIMQNEPIEEAVRVALSLFNYSCPNFIYPSTSAYMYQKTDISLHALNHQMQCFAYEVRTQLTALSIASKVKLYTAIKLDTLAALCDKPVNDIISELIIYKNRTTDHTKGSSESGALSNTATNHPLLPEIDFYIEDEVLYISKNKLPRRIGDWMIRNTNKLIETLITLKQ